MGNNISLKNSSFDLSTIRVMSYNVEWGFITLPKNINYDACGHKLPHTKLAQDTHLKLIAKDIGIIFPDICFLQEIGSMEAIQFIANNIQNMFNINYKFFYSNDQQVGNQGVGLLIKDNISNICDIKPIPNFYLNRSLCVSFEYNTIMYNIVGLHLKSLCDGKIDKDTQEQLQQIDSVYKFCRETDNVIITGDFNNIETSEPIKKMNDYKYTNLYNTKYYEPNIVGNDNTEFSVNNNTSEKGSKIDYMFYRNIKPISFHIINYQRETNQENPQYRSETSDHLPILGIFKLIN